MTIANHESLDVTVHGAFASHPRAMAFAQVVARVHRRYADEVVGTYHLCPHFKDARASFGSFCVMLDPEPTIEGTLAAVQTLPVLGVVHLVFPMARPEPTTFERFSSRFGQTLKQTLPKAPVLAAFHPDLAGDRSTPYRLVGVLRRAPDPFVQLVPVGLHQGGTVFAGAVEPEVDSAIQNYRRLDAAKLDALEAKVAEIHADRARSYAGYLADMGFTSPPVTPAPSAP